MLNKIKKYLIAAVTFVGAIFYAYFRGFYKGKTDEKTALILLNGCMKNTSANDFCLIYSPVYPNLSLDSPETIRQIDWNNIAFDEICK